VKDLTQVHGNNPSADQPLLPAGRNHRARLGVANRLLITLLLPDLEPFYGDLRQRLDPAAGRGLGCHITLVHLPTGPANVGQGLKDIKLALRGMGPFRIAFGSLGQLTDTVYLEPDECPSLSAVAQLVRRQYLKDRGTHTFTPHVSVARYLTEHQVPIVRQEIQRRLNLVGRVTANVAGVDVLRRETDHWDHIETITLR
jgi:2'-5' RNA ligase